MRKERILISPVSSLDLNEFWFHQALKSGAVYSFQYPRINGHKLVKESLYVSLAVVGAHINSILSMPIINWVLN